MVQGRKKVSFRVKRGVWFIWVERGFAGALWVHFRGKPYSGIDFIKVSLGKYTPCESEV